MPSNCGTRAKAAKLLTSALLRALVEEKLELRWSPQQIAGWLGRTYPDDGAMRISHETIYLSLFVQSRGALRHELTAQLRSGRVTRRPQGRVLPSGKGQLTGKLMISERPAEAHDRAVSGHWEGDLLLGKRPSAIATLVERSSLAAADRMNCDASELLDRHGARAESLAEVRDIVDDVEERYGLEPKSLLSDPQTQMRLGQIEAGRGLLSSGARAQLYAECVLYALPDSRPMA